MKKKLTEKEIETISYEDVLRDSSFRNDRESYYVIWNELKDNEEVLKTAIKLVKNRKDEDTLFGLAIAEAILDHYNDVSIDIYNELIKTIYTNETIAKIEGKRKFTFLEMTLYNPDLELTNEQKSFAEKEAMTQPNAKLYNTTYYHSDGSFDIRYLILMHKAWDMEEKAELIYDFYQDDSYYAEVLDDWEWDIVNYYSSDLSELDMAELYEYTYKDISDKYNKEDTDSIYEEITMCKLFHQMRPEKWEISNLDTDSKAVVYTKKNDTI